MGTKALLGAQSWRKLYQHTKIVYSDAQSARARYCIWEFFLMKLSINDVAAMGLNTKTFGLESNLETIVALARQAKAQGKKALFTGELSATGVEGGMMLAHPHLLETLNLEQLSIQLPEDFVLGLGLPAAGVAGGCVSDFAILRHGHKPQRGLLRLPSVSSAVTDSVAKNCAATAVSALGGAFALSHGTYGLLGSERDALTLGQIVDSHTVVVDESKFLVLPFYDSTHLALGELSGLAALEELARYIGANCTDYAFIVMPSAHAFESPASYRGDQDAADLSRLTGLPVLTINNLGCEGGSLIYDGRCQIFTSGNLSASSTQFSFAPYSYVDLGCSADPHQLAVFDAELKAVALGLRDWMVKTHSKGYTLSLSGGADSALCATCVALSQLYSLLDLGVVAYGKMLTDLGIACDKAALDTKIGALTGGYLGPWRDGQIISGEQAGMELTQEQIDGMISVLKAEVMPQILVCAYQASDYSGSVTRTAATEMAASVGATFYQWSIAPAVKDYVDTVSTALGYELTWDKDDIALQNIQARSRLPSIWLLANHKGMLLIATSNLSEAAVGYCTMDGDTAGGLSPIAGIDKSTILKINRHIAEEGVALFGANNRTHVRLEGMKYVVAQEPTAELRPGGEQTDEKDLMPYPLLDEIRRRFLTGMLPQALVASLVEDLQAKRVLQDYPHLQDLSPADIERFVARFITLFQHSQWKRERFATGFHIQPDDVSPKAGCAFPILAESLLKL